MIDLNNNCIIDGKAYSLSEVEKMGLDNFSFSAHKTPHKCFFKYYPNTTKYVKEEKKYHNYSFEALVNNTIFLQDAKNFDDCFDCAVDLDWNKFLTDRVKKYCDYFNVGIESENINDIIYALSLKLYKHSTIEKCMKATADLQDEVQKMQVEIFIRHVFNKVLAGEEWMPAIFSAIQKEFEEFEKILSRFKISCFSTSPYLNRMWSSAYADNNKGFCIEYEIDTSKKRGIELYNNIFPVIYSQARNDFFPLVKNFDKSPSQEDLWQIYYNGLLRKSAHWIDQCEWRLILYDRQIAQNPISFFKIKKVYLGNKMPCKTRKKIVSFCRRNNIEYVGLIRKPNSFDLVDCVGDCFTCPKML